MQLFKSIISFTILKFIPNKTSFSKNIFQKNPLDWSHWSPILPFPSQKHIHSILEHHPLLDKISKWSSDPNTFLPRKLSSANYRLHFLYLQPMWYLLLIYHRSLLVEYQWGRGRVEEMMVWIRELLSRISSRRLIELGGNAAGIVRRWPGIDFASQSRYILSPLHVLLSREYLAANTSWQIVRSRGRGGGGGNSLEVSKSSLDSGVNYDWLFRSGGRE